jgi:predicted TIM-barrel fold metal-dependent hydrolase
MMSDDELRPLICRALNMYMAELHAGLSDRILPVAAIPMHTPDEAIEEMEYAVKVLGMRAVLLPS